MQLLLNISLHMLNSHALNLKMNKCFHTSVIIVINCILFIPTFVVLTPFQYVFKTSLDDLIKKIDVHSCSQLQRTRCSCAFFNGVGLLELHASRRVRCV